MYTCSVSMSRVDGTPATRWYPDPPRCNYLCPHWYIVALPFLNAIALWVANAVTCSLSFWAMMFEASITYSPAQPPTTLLSRQRVFVLNICIYRFRSSMSCTSTGSSPCTHKSSFAADISWPLGAQTCRIRPYVVCDLTDRQHCWLRLIRGEKDQVEWKALVWCHICFTLPSGNLTYPLPRHYSRWFSLSPGGVC